MAIEQLLGDISRESFLEDYYLKRPLALSGVSQPFAGLGSWDTVAQIAEHPEADLMIVRQGERWPGENPPTGEALRRLHDEGYTVLARHAERQHPGLAQLAAEFQRDFDGQVDVHLYCTPGKQFGFGWHYDAEEVFILQTEGTKEYSLRKNTVNPWPLVETLPADMRYEREIMPFMNCSLSAGDMLYIPGGFWHRAAAQTDSISLAIGVLPATGIDLFDFLRARLLESLRWRQRLPAAGDVNPADCETLQGQYSAAIDELTADLLRELKRPDLVRAFLDSRSPPPPEAETTAIADCTQPPIANATESWPPCRCLNSSSNRSCR